MIGCKNSYSAESGILSGGKGKRDEEKETENHYDSERSLNYAVIDHTFWPFRNDIRG